LKVVYSTDSMPSSWSKSIFLAGPTPRSPDVPSWRPEALQLLEQAGYDGVVFVPEPQGQTWPKYDDQAAWERAALDAADAIVFWVPRDMKTMPGLTTNVEFGLYAGSGKVFLGAPPGADSVTYLAHVMGRDVSPSHGMVDTLRGVLTQAVQHVGDGSPRTGGECKVPYHVWTLSSFQAWYGDLRARGDVLHDARLLWQFTPKGGSRPFSWVLWAKVWISAEGRFKENEFVLSRGLISCAVLYHAAPMTPREDVEVVLIREFRTPGGHVLELPGGSSDDHGSGEVTASVEVYEETGLRLSPERFMRVGNRQPVPTFSAHRVSAFVAQLTEDEWSEVLATEGTREPHGDLSTSERTYVTVMRVRDAAQTCDWTTLGILYSAIPSVVR
jgi:8-oxo-dGTP pyrophosphatase MutT (NUDIX family)